MVNNLRLLQVCRRNPQRVITENQERISEFLGKVEQYPDYDTTARLVNVIIPTICKAELTHEVGHVEALLQCNTITPLQHHYNTTTTPLQHLYNTTTPGAAESTQED